MKRILNLGVCLLILITMLTGCGKKDRILYANTNLSSAVELGSYKGIKVDRSSDEFKVLYADEISEDVENNSLYFNQTEGEIANGDVVNIDYTGKKDGVAFEGGTDEGYELTIGSNTFIDGFEKGLIGKKIGDTVDLNLTFPEDYGTADLAGADVVFTVKINHVVAERSPEDYYGEIGYNTLKEYEDVLTKRAVKSYLLNNLVNTSKVKKYPKQDKEFLKEAYIDMLEMDFQNQGVELESYLNYVGQTMEQFEESIISQEIEPTMDSQMPVYALLDAENIVITSEDVDNKIKELIKESGDSSLKKEDLLEYVGEYYFENLVATEKAAEFMYDIAVIS